MANMAGELDTAVQGDCTDSTPTATSATVLAHLLQRSNPTAREIPTVLLRLNEKTLLLENPTAADQKPPRSASRLVKGAAVRSLYRHAQPGNRFAMRESEI